MVGAVKREREEESRFLQTTKVGLEDSEKKKKLSAGSAGMGEEEAENTLAVSKLTH